MVEEGGFLYDADSYAGRSSLLWIIDYGETLTSESFPYTLDNNDMRFATYQGV